MDLASSENALHGEFTTLVEDEGKSRIGTQTYSDEVEDEVSEDSQRTTNQQKTPTPKGNPPGILRLGRCDHEAGSGL